MLETEVEIERRKLDEYWPLSDEPETNEIHARLRRFRIAHEGAKLFGDFPRLMASSALIQTVSAFEYHLLLVCYDHEAVGLGALNDFHPRGRKGTERLLAYVDQATFPDRNIAYLEQLRCALTFRNCLAYTDGMLALSKNREVIRSAIRSERYFSPEIRNRKRSSVIDRHPQILIESIGERLYVPTYYSHWLAAKSRDLLISLCVENILQN